MNIHPLFVHFPIAVFALYSILEIVAGFWPALRRQSWVFPVNAFLLFSGFVSALLALVTGGIAKGLVTGIPTAFILKVHVPFAVATTFIYFVIGAAYLVRILDNNGWAVRVIGQNKLMNASWRLKKKVTHLTLDKGWLPALALLGLVGVIVTAALGTAIVYGPTLNPFVTFVYTLFWPLKP
ncbi:MAG: DUF2231 domain-containing protein [Minisyncoccia bacterium]